MDPDDDIHQLLATDVVGAARSMIGCALVCRGAAGVVVETEAYHQIEPSCHAHKGPTPRSQPLFGPPGTAYVYFTYGMHWCFNVVAEDEGVGAAVLVRAVVPTHGLQLMRGRRERTKPLRERELCGGPARLTQAMDIRAEDNQRVVLEPSTVSLAQALAEPDGLRILRDPGLAAQAGADAAVEVAVGPRIGISLATDLPWRFGVSGSPFLSKPFRT